MGQGEACNSRYISRKGTDDTPRSAKLQGAAHREKGKMANVEELQALLKQADNSSRLLQSFRLDFSALSKVMEDFEQQSASLWKSVLEISLAGVDMNWVQKVFGDMSAQHPISSLQAIGRLDWSDITNRMQPVPVGPMPRMLIEAPIRQTEPLCDHQEQIDRLIYENAQMKSTILGMVLKAGLRQDIDPPGDWEDYLFSEDTSGPEL